MRETLVWLASVVWLSVVTGGFWVWERYDTTPGSVGEPAVASDESPISRWRLMVFVHPHCPCSRATLGEAGAIAAARPELEVRILFVRPVGTPEGWEQGESWGIASRIAGVEVSCDEAGTEAHRVGAATSGHAVLIDPAGRVAFRGGLTAGRARAGESAGRRAVLDWTSGRTGAATAPVFGCALSAHDD